MTNQKHNESSSSADKFKKRVIKDLDLAIQSLIGYSQDLKDDAIINNDLYKNHFVRIRKLYIKAIREAREEGLKEGLQALTRMKIESERIAK